MNDENKFPEWAPALEDLKLGSRVRWNESLKRFNTWRIGGPSRGLVDVETEEDLARLLPFLNKNDIPWFLIGKGSNLLIHDRIWEGVILHLTGDFKSWQPQEHPQHTHSARAGGGQRRVSSVPRAPVHGIPRHA